MPKLTSVSFQHFNKGGGSSTLEASRVTTVPGAWPWNGGISLFITLRAETFAHRNFCAHKLSRIDKIRES